MGNGIIQLFPQWLVAVKPKCGIEVPKDARLWQELGKANEGAPEQTGRVYVCPNKVDWPVYDEANSKFVDWDSTKDGWQSMLDLSPAEGKALAPLFLDVEMRKERGKLSQGHTYNWKKTAISKVYWRRERVNTFQDLAGPTKAKAAYSWLLQNNRVYKQWIKRHDDWIDDNTLSKQNRNLKTADLLLHSPGVETACYPLLYPREAFGDTNYKERLGMNGTKWLADNANPSIKKSYLIKCSSRITAYASNAPLTFLLHDIAMARQISAALSVAERKNLGADIIEGNKHYSESYWRHEQDINADVVLWDIA